MASLFEAPAGPLLPKAPTGIPGLDEITKGGLPRGSHRDRHRGARRERRAPRHGIEEYVSDCVIVLDHRVHDGAATRHLQVVKYRGSAHETNQYPFLISPRGFTVFPVTAVVLEYGASEERISIGVPRLDYMLSGGLLLGSAVLVSGAAGTGKTTLGGHLVDAACARGERALLILHEESAGEVMPGCGSRKMNSAANGSCGRTSRTGRRR